MLVLGIVLVVVAVGIAVAVVIGGANDQAAYVLGGLHVQMSTAWAFLLGALVLLVFVIGLGLARTGARRAHRRRKDAKELNRRSAELSAREKSEQPGQEHPE